MLVHLPSGSCLAACVGVRVPPDPDHWFWALEMITGADPVPVEAYGDTVQMAQAWTASYRLQALEETIGPF